MQNVRVPVALLTSFQRPALAERLQRCARRFLLLLVMVLLTATADRHALAADAVTFQGMTIKINVGFGPGGGYDAYARVLARYLGKHLPGNPAVIARNKI